MLKSSAVTSCARGRAASASPNFVRAVLICSVDLFTTPSLEPMPDHKAGSGRQCSRADSLAGGSDLREATIDEKFGAVDEAGIVGGQEQKRLGDFLPLADAAERNLGVEIVGQALLSRSSRTGEVHEALLSDLDPRRQP